MLNTSLYLSAVLCSIFREVYTFQISLEQAFIEYKSLFTLFSLPISMEKASGRCTGTDQANCRDCSVPLGG
jgi:hypothetical protein